MLSCVQPNSIAAREWVCINPLNEKKIFRFEGTKEFDGIQSHDEAIFVYVLPKQEGLRDWQINFKRKEHNFFLLSVEKYNMI